MMKTYGIALGAGVTSAVLVAVASTRTPAGFLLSELAPLPVMIVGLGFDLPAGAVAAVASGIGVGIGFGPLLGVLSLALSGLPSLLLARLAVRGRPSTGGPTAWTRVSTLLLWLVAAVCVPLLVLGGVMLAYQGGYGAVLTAESEKASQALAGRDLPIAISPELIRLLVPLGIGIWSTIVLAGNLWGAARSVQLSGLLVRPWPNLPDELRLPRAAVGVFAVLCAGVRLPDPIGIAAALCAGALGVAFTFEGLALVHVRSRGFKGRAAVLTAVYLVVLLVQPWPPFPLLAVTLVGCLDSLFPSLRRGAGIRITKLPKRRP